MVSQEVAQLIVLTLVPWLELRGSIPYALATGMSPLLAFSLAAVTNIVLIYPVFFVLDLVFPYLGRYSLTKKLLDYVQRRTGKYVERWGFLGLAVFTAIPLPGSGVYTASLAAYVFAVPKQQARKAIAFGVVVAGALVTLISLNVLHFF